MAVISPGMDDISRRGIDLYERSIKHLVDMPENRGRVIVIDTLSGDFEIDEDHLAAAKRAKMRNPDAVLFATRIGFPALGRIGGRFGTPRT
jgi:hypothetical protein